MRYTDRQMENTETQMNRRLIALMAAASGISVANIYYIQPLLQQIADFYHVSHSSAGLLAMLTQIGYALGLFLILPLADLVERKKLILRMLVLAAGSLMLMFISKNYALTAVACLAVGMTSVIPQLMVPLGAQLSNEEERGKNIGHILSGLLVGVLVSRVFSGFVGKYFGWKMIYLVAVVMMVFLFILIRLRLPACEVNKNHDMRYLPTLKSMAKLPKRFPVLTEASVNAALFMVAFSALWTVLTFHLQGSPFHFDTNIVGAFGLIGVTGILFAPFAGKLSDRKGATFTVGLNMVIIMASYLCFAFFGFQIWGLILGIVLLDLGVQCCNVANQTRIQKLSDEARNRITSVYMVSLFGGGAAGSFLGSLLYAGHGWYGFCAIGIFAQIAAIIIHAMANRQTGQEEEAVFLEKSSIR